MPFGKSIWQVALFVIARVYSPVAIYQQNDSILEDCHVVSLLAMTDGVFFPLCYGFSERQWA